MAKMKFYSLWLCLICIIVFIFQLIIPGFTELFVLNQASFFEVWRFVSAIFLHGGVAHLLYNLFALAFFGIILEKLIGSSKFLIVFFVSGIIANLIAVNFYSSSLGASGAIMGIIGCLTIIKPFMMVWAFGLILPMFLAAILWVIGDVLGVFLPSGVGNIAHLSGIAVGFIIGIFLRLQKFLISDSAQEHKFLTEWITVRKELIKIPKGYMRLWENRHMR